MAGHSKWAQIKRKKAVTDARRGKLWTRLLREITVAARLGGGDPEANPRLRTAIQDAKDNNVPNDNIERAVKKGTGELEGGELEEVAYEGYGPGGAAILVETLTDNRNRTVSELRHLFDRHGGNLGESGCVAWIFDKQGYFLVPCDAVGEEELMELVVELGGEDILLEGADYEVRTAGDVFHQAKRGFEEHGVAVREDGLEMVPSNTVDVAPQHTGQLLALMDALEDHDDVQDVWSNFEIDDELLRETG